MTRLHNLGRKWLDEFRLIRNIYAGRYPNKVKYSISYLERIVMCLLVFVRSLSLSHIRNLALQKEGRTQLSELYVVAWFTALVVLLFVQPCPVVFPLLVAYRLIDGFDYQLCIIFVDRYRSSWSLRSPNRSLILLLIYYFELMVGFAALFLYTGSVEFDASVLTNPWDALYFSVLTITTLGDEGFKIVSALGRVLLSIETIMGVVFLVLVVSTFINNGITMRSSRRAKSARG